VTDKPPVLGRTYDADKWIADPDERMKAALKAHGWGDTPDRYKSAECYQ
jgi:hypothetical protein